MHPLRLVSLQDQRSIPWANGGGLTRDLLVWPQADHWALRISVAQIDRAGPFSHFPGYQRWFAVAEGAGVELSFPEGDQQLKLGHAPLCFDGAQAPGCQLIQGQTLDLNLMVRQSAGQGQMIQALIGQAWIESTAWRAVYVHEPLILTVGVSDGDSSQHALPAQTLAYSENADRGPWTLHRDGAANSANDLAPLAAWWMTFDSNRLPAQSN